MAFFSPLDEPNGWQRVVHRMEPKLSIREAVNRGLSYRNRPQADRLIRWLDECGYAIVDKCELHRGASLAPDHESADDSFERQH